MIKSPSHYLWLPATQFPLQRPLSQLRFVNDPFLSVPSHQEWSPGNMPDTRGQGCGHWAMAICMPLDFLWPLWLSTPAPCLPLPLLPFLPPFLKRKGQH